MSGFQYDFRGSCVLFEFSDIDLCAKDVFGARSVVIDELAVDVRKLHTAHVGGDDCVIDSNRSNCKLRDMRRKISASDKRASLVLITEMTHKDNTLTEETLDRYSSMYGKRRPSLATLQMERLFEAKEICMKATVLPKLKRLDALRRILTMRQDHRMTLKAIASSLGMTLGAVASKWTEICSSGGDVIVQADKVVREAIEKEQCIQQMLATIESQGSLGNKTLQQLYDEAMRTKQSNVKISFNKFYNEFKSLGFRFRPINFAPKTHIKISAIHLNNFLHVYIYFLMFEYRFELIFIDESSICPSNFKKRAWCKRGQSSVIQSRIKYEKITLLGAMSRDCVVGFQFLHSGFDSRLFFAFIQEVVDSVAKTIGPTRQIVLFMDNCSSHRSDMLMRFCRHNHVLLLFNLAHRCEFNPIEYLWEALKRPFRSMVDYEK